jgi:hypothetical protein
MSFARLQPAASRRGVRATLEPQLRDSNGIWVADYVRLRFAATKIAG